MTPLSVDPAAVSFFEDVAVVDADTHLTEPHDLWTSRAPASLRDRVPHVEEHNGGSRWVVDGIFAGLASGFSVVNRAGEKVPGTGFIGWGIDEVHPGAYSVPERLAVMDEMGVLAQIVYPNTFGFGGQGLAKVTDEALRLATATIYNDAMAELQEESGGRLMPMAVLPWWNLEAAVAEVERAHDMGLRGINTTSAPHHHGLPDLGDDYWDPLWEVSADLHMPVNFHIGAAESDMAWFGSVSWPSLNFDLKLGLGSAMLYINNAGVLANLVYAGVLERFPRLRIVSVESAVGWIPFMMQALDYQVGEMPAEASAHLSLAPSEYFRRQIYACFWFEQSGVNEAIKALGHERILFETDFPHPTCTFPKGLSYAAQALREVDKPVRRAIMGENAAKLYRIDLATLIAATSAARPS